MFDVHVEHGWALVALRDGMVRVVRNLWPADNVTPVYTDFVAGFDVDDLAGHGRLEARVAGNVGIVYIVD